MATPNTILLYQYKPTFLLWLMPLFAVIGCLLVAMSVSLPLLLRPALDLGMYVSIGIAFAAGLAMPLGAVLMWLLIPAVTTTYDADRGLVTLAYQRPFTRSEKVYRVSEIADVGLMSTGTRTHTLALWLKNGQRVRMDYGGTSYAGSLQTRAAEIRATIGVGPTATIGI